MRPPPDTPARRAGAVLVALGALALFVSVGSISSLGLMARCGGPLLLAAGALVYFARDTRELAAAIARQGRQTWAREKPELLAVIALTTIGAILRARILGDAPFRYDESYSFLYFASQPVGVAVSDYHVPNNHILHSLLMHFAWRAFGDAEWVLRLPAFAAGTLLVPATYAVGRMLNGRVAAVVAAALVVPSAALVAYSANGRGYTMMILFFLIAVALGAAVLRRPYNRALWTLWAANAVLGFCTMPLMALPLGVVGTWLSLSLLLGGSHGDRWRRLAPLTAASATALVVCGVLYWPLRHQRGFDYSWIRDRDLGALVYSTLDIFAAQVPVVVQALLIALAAIGLMAHRAIGRQPLPLAVGLVAIPVIVLFTGQLPPFERTWFFVLPLLAIMSGAGAAVLVRHIRGPLAARVGLVTVLALATALGIDPPPQRVWATDLGYARDADVLARYFARPENLGVPVLVDPRSGTTWRFYMVRHDDANHPFIDRLQPVAGVQTALIPVHDPQSTARVLAEAGVTEGMDVKRVERLAHTTIYQVTY